MATYYDSYNNGNWNFLGGSGSSGDTFNVGQGKDWITGVSNETINVSGGLYVAPYRNQFSFTGTNNVINLLGTQTYLFLGEFSPSDNIQNIVGNSTSDKIYASSYPAGGVSLDFSATTLINISGIYGNSYGDSIKGSGQYVSSTHAALVPIYGGVGDDVFWESGPDQVGETKGADTIDGGSGSNVYYASGVKSSYTPGLVVNGNAVFHNGTTWNFLDAGGMQITLYNIQKVGFTDQTLYSGLSPMTDSDTRANTVAVGAANGTSVGLTASTIDGTNGTVTYSLIGGASPFAINGSTGVVTVGDSSQITGSATSYTITVQATDGSLTTTGTYTIGVTYPTLVLANDTGSSSSDRVTSVATLAGTGIANATVTIKNGSAVLGTATASSTGAWSFTPTGLGDGSFTLTASEANSGGTVGTATLAFTLDTTVPSIGMALANDTGASNSDHITSSATLTGTGDAGATVTIRNGSSVLGTTTANGTGAWSFSPTGLADGTYTLTASETDLAGNTGTGSFGLTLDTTAPKPLIKAVTGNQDGGITLTGVAEANSTVSVADTAGGSTTAFGTATASGSGTWQITTHTVMNTSVINTFAASATDVAGNAGTMPGRFYLTSTGADTLTSNAGVSDVFAIMSFKGSDVINGFETTSGVGANHDLIDFSGRGISSFSQVQSMMSGSTSTVINIGSGKTITLNGIAPSQLTASDFVYS